MSIQKQLTDLFVIWAKALDVGQQVTGEWLR